MGNAKKTLFAHTLARFSNYGGDESSDYNVTKNYYLIYGPTEI